MNPETDYPYYVTFEPDTPHSLKYAIVYAITPTKAREKAALRFGPRFYLHDNAKAAGVKYGNMRRVS